MIRGTRAACLVLVVAGLVGTNAGEVWEEYDLSMPVRSLQTGPQTPEEVAQLYKDCALSLGTNPDVFYETKFECCDVLTVGSADEFLNITAGNVPGFKALCGNACRCRLSDSITCKCGNQEVSGSALDLGIFFAALLGFITIVCCFIDKRQTAFARSIDKQVHDGFIANESMSELMKEDKEQPSL